MAVIQQRRGTAAAWASANPVLAIGEPGYETDTGYQKVGNGSTAWNLLPYLNADLRLAVSSTQRLATSPKNYMVGVYYFPGWSTPGGGYAPSNPWSVIPADRVPLIGAFDETTQANCDYQLELMRDYGIDFVVVEMYFQDGGSGTIVPFLDHFLNRYMTSTVVGKPKLMLMWVADTNAYIYNQSNWPTVYGKFLPYFRDPNYVKVNGKPAIILFSVPTIKALGGGTDSGTLATLNQFRSAVASEFGGVHIYGSQSTSDDFWQQHIAAAGYDGVTAYTVFTKTQLYGSTPFTSRTGFAQFDDALFGLLEDPTGNGTTQYRSWFGHAGYPNPAPSNVYPPTALQAFGWAGTSIPTILTPVSTGWDARPWMRGQTAAQWTAQNPVLADKEVGFETDTGKQKTGNGSAAWNSISTYTNVTVAVPTDAEFEAHLVKARSATDAARTKTKGMVVICAWNEYGEGQWLMPTRGGGFGRLAAIKKVFCK